MELSLPFVLNGKRYDVEDLSKFVCAECGGPLATNGKVIQCGLNSRHDGIKLREGKMEEGLPDLESMKTLTGINIMDALTELNKQLDANAYKPVSYGGAQLTDINPGYLLEELNKIFGPCGVGWRFTFHRDNFQLTEGKTEKGQTIYTVILIGLEFYYILKTDDRHIEIGPIMSTGGVMNMNRGSAYKGAVTNALGSAVHRLGWQVDVYKGLRTFSQETKPSVYGVEVSFLDAASAPLKPDVEKILAASTSPLAPMIQFRLLESLDASQPGEKLRELIGEDAYRAVMRTVVGLLNAAECTWDFSQEMMGKEAKDLTIGELINLWVALVAIADGDKKEDVIARFKVMTEGEESG